MIFNAAFDLGGVLSKRLLPISLGVLYSGGVYAVYLNDVRYETINQLFKVFPERLKNKELVFSKKATIQEKYDRLSSQKQLEYVEPVRLLSTIVAGVAFSLFVHCHSKTYSTMAVASVAYGLLVCGALKMAQPAIAFNENVWEEIKACNSKEISQAGERLKNIDLKIRKEVGDAVNKLLESSFWDRRYTIVADLRSAIQEKERGDSAAQHAVNKKELPNLYLYESRVLEAAGWDYDKRNKIRLVIKEALAAIQEVDKMRPSKPDLPSYSLSQRGREAVKWLVALPSAFYFANVCLRVISNLK